ncbi:phosphatase PAP2 family protein [Neorhizobium petrolearium]|uniref:Phosphatase PAP2 family protein n=2 Tax=Neorhizobium petrolearium TaxID=515361 RepID=A0ABY8M4R1_9HYPH|nr:phosphatase PAP2 family protein [Neorhizobium petrolearium]WGI69449.1 phosphatase PAP2 family protein [Neorhizobium petrolearium]
MAIRMRASKTFHIRMRNEEIESPDFIPINVVLSSARGPLSEINNSAQPAVQEILAMTVRQFLSRPSGWFIVLFGAWWLLLAIFYLFPRIDIWVAHAFFIKSVCGGLDIQGQICGSFPYGTQAVFIVIRRIFFYLPALVAIYLLYRLLANLQHHGTTYCRRKTRDYSIALTGFLLGPLVVVNMILKEISDRPRPYQTDFFGGRHVFMPAGDFQGACANNCSFVSGEAAGAGWLACLIVLIPKPLRPILGPPLITISLISPALRVAFGGHYFSDVTLGWLSSLVIYACVAACFEMSQRERKRELQTNL